MSRRQAKSKASSPNVSGRDATGLLTAKPPWLTAVFASLLLIQFAGLSIWEMVGDSVTIDERVYLPAGYNYWIARDFSLNPEHPPFAKLLAAAPLLALDLKLPKLETARETNNTQAAAERQMRFGSQFLYSQDVDRIMFWGRLPMLALGLLLGACIFLWSKELHGHAGAGLVSLFLFTLEPTLIAHSHYVTTDIAPAAFSVFAMFFLFRFSRAAKLHHLILAAVGLGLAMASKFSAIFLAPVFFVLLIYRWPAKELAASHHANYNSHTARIIVALTSLVITAFTIQASYLFSSDLSLYWKGLFAVNVNELPQSLLTYVHGQFTPGGVWWYPLYVIALKTPLPAIIGIIIAGVATLTHRDKPKSGLIFVLVPVVVFTLATCTLANNLGIRYMIPVIAFLLVFAGRAWWILTRNKRYTIAASLLAIWLVISVLRVSPHYISYFNELIGGPENGPYYLDDSNIDWGQDLKRLSQYLEKNRINKLVLAYWGPTPPEYYLGRTDISFQPWTHELAEPENPPAGIYALSVNHLVGIKRDKLWLEQPFDPKMDWLKRFQPSDRIGYSIYLYKFPGPTARRRADQTLDQIMKPTSAIKLAELISAPMKNDKGSYRNSTD